MPHSTRKQNKAFATLFSVIVLGVITLVLVTSMLTQVIDSNKVNMAVRSGIMARSLADSCAEIAINKLKLNNSYTGETVTLETGTCTVLSISGTGNSNRIVRTVGTVTAGNGDIFTRKVEVSIGSINPSTVIIYWQEKVF